MTAAQPHRPQVSTEQVGRIFTAVFTGTSCKTSRTPVTNLVLRRRRDPRTKPQPVKPGPAPAPARLLPKKQALAEAVAVLVEVLRQSEREGVSCLTRNELKTELAEMALDGQGGVERMAFRQAMNAALTSGQAVEVRVGKSDRPYFVTKERAEDLERELERRREQEREREQTV